MNLNFVEAISGQQKELLLRPNGGLPVSVASDEQPGGDRFRIWNPWELFMETLSETGDNTLHYWVSPGNSQYNMATLHLEGVKEFDLHVLVLPGGTATVKVYCLGLMQNSARTVYADILGDGAGSTGGHTITQNATYTQHWHWSSANNPNTGADGPKWRQAQFLWIQPQFLFSAANVPIMAWITGRY